MQSSTFTLTDAPQAPPEVVRLNLRSQSLWEDSLDIVALKVEVGSKLLEWLNNLVEWLLAKLTAIFEKAKEALEWCWTQVKELFGVLYAVLKK
jgi:hypothetical protein